ncbi:MAG: NUDIX hydrolase [Eubacteriaceae bacterium]|nr:NUDIX hydrolase [Eubacteriaceae bacterium]
MWVGGVRVVIFDEEMRLLMVRQHHEGRDIWMVPGGAIEDGETARVAAVREVKEETGLEIKVDRMIWHIEEVSKKRGQRFVNYFGAEIIGGHAALGEDPEFDEEHQVLRELRFMSREEIISLSEKVYPSALKDEIWKLADGDLKGYDAFQVRE